MNEPGPIASVAPIPEAIDYFVDEVDTRALSGKAVSGAVYTAVAQVARIVMSITSQIVLSRLLFPAQFGIVAMVAPVLAIVSLFNDLGLSQAVIQKERITQDDLSALYWLGLGTSTACALLLIAISPLIAMAYHQRVVGPVCIALACQIPIAALAGHASALMARKMRFGAIAAVEITAQAMGLTTSIVSARAGAGYWALVLGQFAVTLTQAVGDRYLSHWRPSRFKRSANALSMLKFGANLTGFNALSLFSTYSDNVLVGILKGPGALGLFDKAFSLVLRPVGSITAPISRVATPLLARVVSQPSTYRKAFIGMLQGVILLGSPGLIVGALRSQEIVTTVLGKPWAGAGPIMAWISVAALFTSLSGSSYWIFTSQNRPNEQLQCGFISSGLILVSMLAGLPWGPVGIARSYAVFAPFVHGCFIWKATRVGPVRRQDIFRGIYPSVFAILLAAAAVVLTTGKLSKSPLLDLLMAIALSYGITALGISILPEGRRSARTLWEIRSRAS